MRLASLRARLLAGSLVLVAVGLIAADVATYSVLRSFLYSRLDEQLAAAHTSVERALSSNGVLATEALRQLSAVAPGVWVQVRNESGDVLVTVAGRPRDSAPSEPRLSEELLAVGTGTGDAIDPTRADAVALPRSRVASVPAAEAGGPRYRVRVASLFEAQGTLVLALPLDATNDTLHQLLLVEVGATLLVLAAAAGGGLWLVRLGLRPLTDIEATASEITGGHLDQRVAAADDRTEVGRLGTALNAMLDTIDSAFAEQRASEESARASEQRMRRFVADASHELRTPVAAVRAYAELYRMGADRHPEDLARLLSRIESEAERMGVLVEDLLLLTRLDERQGLDRVPVDLGAVAIDAVAAARALEPDRPIDLEVEGLVEVLGDKGRLRQVVDNLLANVRSHTPEGTPATVTVRAEGDRALLEVADRGPGFGTDDPDRLFERFTRVDPSRSRDRGGAGLGLSIAAAIVEAHDGTISASDRPEGGAAVRIEVPLLAPSAE